MAVAAILVSASPAAAATIQTVAGNGALKPLGDNGPATSAALAAPGDIAATSDGGFLVIDGSRVRKVSVDGRITTVAGTGKVGFSGDGGPATSARLDPTGIAVDPAGGFLVAECHNGRVRRVSEQGVITTVAGKGPRFQSPAFHFAGDGGPATSASLACPGDVAVQADGSFLIADRENRRVRRVGTDGVITTFAGSAKNDGDRNERGDGGPATQANFTPRTLAVAPDGAVFIADLFHSRVRRVGTDGVITTVAGDGSEGVTPRDPSVATKVPVTPQSIAVAADGSLLIGNTAEGSCLGAGPAVLRVADGRMHRVAGSGRFILDPVQGDERRGDGGPPSLADLRGVLGVAPAPDGGVLIVDGQSGCSDVPVPGLVRYVPPDSPGMFAANFVSAQNRVFAPGSPLAVRVALTQPGSVTVAGQTAQLPAGESTVTIPALGSRPATLELTATSTTGVEAHDSIEVYPNGWLTSARASIDAAKLAFQVPRLRFGFTASPILGCRRFGPARVDCKMTENRRRCDGILSISLRAGSLWWGEYRCPYRKAPAWRKKPRRMNPRLAACDDEDRWCVKHQLALPFPWGTDYAIFRAGLL